MKTRLSLLLPIGALCAIAGVSMAENGRLIVDQAPLDKTVGIPKFHDDTIPEHRN